MRDSFELVEERIQPLLHGWLQHPRNGMSFFSYVWTCNNREWPTAYGETLIRGTDNDASELEQIRRACLPEIVLAYIVVVNSSAHYVSRDLLLKSLDIGAAVASKDSDLASCFTATGRMSELVDSLALTSSTMLMAEEQGRGKKKTSARLGIWSYKGSPDTVA